MTRRVNSRRIRELDPRLAWLLMMLYPRTWRDRYGAEVLRLTRELIAAGETTPARAAVNLAGAAVAERCRALAHAWRPAIVMAAAVLVAAAGGLYATGHAYRAAPASAVPAPAPASLVRVLCTVPRPASGGVQAGRVQAPRGQGAGRLCVVLSARCKAGKWSIVKLTPRRPVTWVTTNPGSCVSLHSGRHRP